MRDSSAGSGDTAEYWVRRSADAPIMGPIMPDEDEVMNETPDPRLVELLACPQCRGGLAAGPGILRCSGCGGEYDVIRGIPCLYPPSMDEDHLREEESLADVMERAPGSGKERFSLAQWKESKREFWEMVEADTGAGGWTMLNIGSGFDTGFRKLQSKGGMFVNFDLVYRMLDHLRSEEGAQHCVAGDINSLPFGKGTFDYVISIDVIHHEFDRLEETLSSFASLLKPGGTLFLEDPNAWGLFQFPKSILLPRPVYRLARKLYHRMRRSTHRPAEYEFPTSVWKVKRTLKRLGFAELEVYPNRAYPEIGRWACRLYGLLSKIEFIGRYHNFHYMIRARL